MTRRGVAQEKTTGGAMARIDSVLLDRDGTIIADKHYLSDPAGVELLPGAARALQQLYGAGISLFVVTNQSGIGRGCFSEEEYRACHAAMVDRLSSRGVVFTGSAFCPHAPEAECACRKPSLGMWQNLAAAYGLDAARSAMIGDKADDVLFGRSANFPAVVLVLTGKGRGEAAAMNLPLPGPDEAYRVVEAASLPGGENLPHAVARDLPGAVRYILDIRDS